MELSNNKKVAFGISASSYHYEGGNYNSDWYEFEKRRFANDASHQCGLAVDYWNRWPEDNATLSELGATVFRTSVEWSRIEPSEGVFDEEAIEKYKEIFGDLKKRNIQITLTLFHYVAPAWFTKKGGFAVKENLHYFRSFTERVLAEFHDYIDIITPMNEMFVYTVLAYITGEFPPESRSLVSYVKVTRNLLRSHFIVAELIEEGGYKVKLSTAEHFRNFRYRNNWLLRASIGKFHNYLFNKALTTSIMENSFAFPFGFAGKITKKPFKQIEYVGLQSYPAIDLRLGFKGGKLRASPIFHTTWAKGIYESKYRPEDLKEAIHEYNKFGKKILITECGINTNNDSEKSTMLTETFKVIKEIKAEEIPLEAFMFFTLFDCFEWSQGYSMKFGVIEVNRETFARTPKESFYTYKKLIETY
jgi:beta-glucosidase